MHTFIHQTDREPKGTGFSLSSKAFLAFIEGVMLLPVEGRVSRRDFTLREIEEGRSDSANKVIFYNVTKTYSFDVTRIFQRHLRVILLFISNFITPTIPQYRKSQTLPLPKMTRLLNAKDWTHTTSAKGTRKKTTWKAQQITSRQVKIFFSVMDCFIF